MTLSTITATTRVILITGANKGIGLEVARQLALRSSDFHIILGSRDPELGAKAALSIQKESLDDGPVFVTPVTIDVQSDASISAAVQRVEKDFGRVDVLINNAGISAEGKPGASLREQYAETFDVNLFGVAVLTEAFLPLLSQSPIVPRLVFVSSRLGSLGLIADAKDVDASVKVPAYRSSKAALNMLTAYYAKKCSGWKVNAGCPGFTATDLNNFRGTQTVQEAAINIVRLATLDDDGPTGTFSNIDGELPW